MLSLQMWFQIRDRHPIFTIFLVALLSASLVNVIPAVSSAGYRDLDGELKELSRDLKKLEKEVDGLDEYANSKTEAQELCVNIETLEESLEQAGEHLKEEIEGVNDRIEKIRERISDLKEDLDDRDVAFSRKASIKEEIGKLTIELTELNSLREGDLKNHASHIKEMERDLKGKKKSLKKLVVKYDLDSDCFDEDDDTTSTESGSSSSGSSHRSEVTDPCLVWIEHQKDMDNLKFWGGNILAGVLGGAGIFLAFKAEKDAAKDLKEQRKFAQQQYNDALQNGGLRMFSRNGAGFPGGIPPIFGPSSAVIGAAAAAPLNATLGPVMGALGAINGSGPINLNIGAGAGAGAGASVSGSTGAAGSASARGSLGGMSQLELYVLFERAKTNPELREQLKLAVMNDTSIDGATRQGLYTILSEQSSGSWSSSRVEGGDLSALLGKTKDIFGQTRDKLKGLRGELGGLYQVTEQMRSDARAMAALGNIAGDLKNSLDAMIDNMDGLEKGLDEKSSRARRFQSSTRYRRSVRSLVSGASRAR